MPRVEKGYMNLAFVEQMTRSMTLARAMFAPPPPALVARLAAVGRNYVASELPVEEQIVRCATIELLKERLGPEPQQSGHVYRTPPVRRQISSTVSRNPVATVRLIREDSPPRQSLIRENPKKEKSRRNRPKVLSSSDDSEFEDFGPTLGGWGVEI